MLELTLATTTIVSILAGILYIRTMFVRRFDHTKVNLQDKVAIVTGMRNSFTVSRVFVCIPRQ